MLLVEFYRNGTLTYNSIDGHGLTHNWKPRVIAFEAPTMTTPSSHGGYAKMSFGKITFSPSLFYSASEGINDWPPPTNGTIRIYYTDTDEASRELVFEGTAHLSDYDYQGVTYSLYGSSYDTEVVILTSGALTVGQKYKITNYVAGDDFVNVGGANITDFIFTATGTTPTVWANGSTLAPYYNDTLVKVITDILSLIPEISSVESTYARSVSPNVAYAVPSDILAVNLAGDIAEFYSHFFYIIDGVAYLVDMLGNNGTTKTLTEFQFFKAPKYEQPCIAEVATAYDEITYKASSSYPYGSSLSVDCYHTTEANIQAAIDDILTLENSQRISNLCIPMIAGNFPLLGQRIDIPDTAHVADLSSYIRARKLTFDFIGDQIKIEGEGVIAAG